jgi:GrpB-like predicted nucleotidyltransferase (UPF0157 family)
VLAGSLSSIGDAVVGNAEWSGRRSVARPDPKDVAAYEAEFRQSYVGGPPPPLQAPIELCDYDPAWPQLYQREAARIRSVLGDRVVRLEHVGSTSVPGLAAKPILDLVLEVPDAADEAAYVPAMEAAGYVLRIREPEWYQHRLFKGPDTNINLHVFSAGCPDTDQMLRFRDWLRGNAGDRELYVRTKRELAARPWPSVQQYADAKTAVIGAILARAQGRRHPVGGRRLAPRRRGEPCNEMPALGSDSHSDPSAFGP